jgi:hypothetical protein
MWKYIILVFLLSSLACSLFSIPSVHPASSPMNLQPTTLPFRTPAVMSDYEGTNSRIDICNFSLEIPSDWRSEAISSGDQINADGPCHGYALTNSDSLLTLTIKPDNHLVELFQTCPAGTIIIQYTSMYIVRFPDVVNNGFVYSYSPVLVGPEGNRLFMCQTPPALWVAGTFFDAQLTKRDGRFYQMDLDTVDKIIQSITVHPN